MSELPDFMIDVQSYDVGSLLAEWFWLVPQSDTPLFVTVFGDWVFGSPDGSLWALSLLEGDYRKIAENAAEYNTFKKSFEWLDQNFMGGWQEIAHRHGFVPTHDQCIGWK